MDLNFKQISKIFDFREKHKGDFFIYFTFFQKHFVIFRYSENNITNKCLFVNSNRIIDASELFQLCNEIETYKKEVFAEGDFLFDKFIPEENIYRFAINLISFNSAESDVEENETLIKFYNLIKFNQHYLNYDCKSFFYCDIEKSFSLKLVSDDCYDFIDFSPTSFSQRFGKTDCYYTSTNEKEDNFQAVIFTFNPFLFENFFTEEKFPHNFKSIVPGLLNNKKVIKIFDKLSEKECIFLAKTITDGLLHLQLLTMYITLYRGKTVSYHHTGDSFSIEIFLVADNITKYVQLCTDIQTDNTGNETSQSISDHLFINFNQISNKQFKVLTMQVPVSLCNINKCFYHIANFYGLNFKLFYY